MRPSTMRPSTMRPSVTRLRPPELQSGRPLPALGLLAVLALAGCSPEQYPQTTLIPRADFADITQRLFDTTLRWALLVFVLVEGALLYAIFRFRARPGDAEPKQVHGNTVLEIIWTLIPALILAFIAVPTVRAIFQTNTTPPASANPLTIEVIGHQWWWEFRYPEYKVTTANQMHVPVGRTVSLRMSTADVLHSFWLPAFGGKRDVFPNRETRIWFTARDAGEYPGQCAEFCGLQHARMGYMIMAQPPAEFDAWIARMQATGPKPPAAAAPAAPAADSVRTTTTGASVGAVAVAAGEPGQGAPAQGAAADTGAARAGGQQGPGAGGAAKGPLYAQGEKLFLTKGCVGCHALAAVNAPQGLIGPNLANFAERTWIAARTVPNTPENLARWIRDPQGVKVGVLMPNLGVTEPESRALAEFLNARR